MIKNEVAKAALELTRDWAVEELEAARLRAMNMRVGGEAYNHAISAVEQLTRIVDSIAFSLGEQAYPDPYTVEKPSAKEQAEEYITSLTEEFQDEPDPDPDPKPARVVDLAEVRTKAKAARDAGVKLSDVWAAFDATKLSEVPVEKYGDVLDLLEEKLGEID